MNLTLFDMTYASFSVLSWISLDRQGFFMGGGGGGAFAPLGEFKAPILKQ